MGWLCKSMVVGVLVCMVWGCVGLVDTYKHFISIPGQ